MAPLRVVSAPLGADGVVVVSATKSSVAISQLRRGNFSSAPRAAKWSFRRALAALVQGLVLALAGVYAAGQLAVFTPVYSQHLRPAIADWWGPFTHVEMVAPTYFVLAGVLPTLAAVLLVEVLRQLRLRRVASGLVLRLASWARRRPSACGGRWVCWFSYGELLFQAVLVGGNACVFYYACVARLPRQPAPFEQLLKSVAVALGMNCLFNMAFLFLPATRNCAWMELLNISYASGVKYHRWLGVLTVATAVTHGAGFYWAWLLEGTWRDKCLPCFDCALDSPRGRRVWLNVFGELALLVFVLIGATSVPWVRRRFYNAFYYTHQLFVLSVAFLVMHWAPSIWWLAPSFLLYVVSRSLSSANSFTPVQVKEFTALDNDIVKVVIARSTARDGDYKVGQFVYLNVPSVSKLQWHAFTIGSSPRSDATTLTILLKSLGDWTKDLVHYAEDCKRDNVLPTVFMDGYYGASLEMYDEYSTVLLVGGGIGATPLFAILEDMVAKLSSGQPLAQRVFFAFSFRELSLLEEIHPTLAKIRELDPQERYFSFDLCLTRPPSLRDLRRPVHRVRSAPPHPSAREMSASRAAKPFAEPARATALRTVVFLAALLGATGALLWQEFIPESDGDDARPSLWPFKYFMEAATLFLAAAAVLLLVLAERVARRARRVGRARALKVRYLESDPYEKLLPEPSGSGSPRSAANALGLHCVEDLLTEYRVAVGQRLEVPELLRRAHHAHTYGGGAASGAIGVFVSGPEALKEAAARGIAAIASEYFDVHEEEFEL
ncbi:hypothetical protein PybrP1_010756 [[Pythium] brassicae (nom. inval.)]|nr:hypothetical protein PybrP1_010756 [[Pythium] brassicae (nom. inval.)]